MLTKKTKLFLVALPVLAGIFVFSSFGNAATCTITSAKWSKNSVKVGESIQMVASVQNPADCANQNIGFQIFESDLAGSIIGSDDSIAHFVKTFTGTSSTFSQEHTFTIQDWERGESENPGTIYFTALPQNQSNFTKSNFILLSPAQAGNGGTTITNFNVTSNQGNLNFTFQVSIPRPAELKSFCGADPFWAAREINPIKLVRNGQFALSGTNYKFDFSEPGQAANKTYEGVIICGTNQVAQSQPISCNSQGVCQSGTGTSGTVCGTPGQPACKPGTTQTYPFEITNPLKGGANDFTSLVKILAQWIFNLAIPIAVAMIVYSGILFLTAQGEEPKITKAKDVLKYAVIGLAIILIGSGFVTLIKSVLELGSGTPPPSSGVPPPDFVGPPAPGAVGNKCNRDRDCLTGLKCSDTICQRPTGNWATEPCNSAKNCDIGLVCDKSDSGLQPIDGQNLGTCIPSGVSGGQIGDLCQKDSNCISGLKCNQICQRKDGNLNGEPCVNTADNCKSNACSTLGNNVAGTCVTNPTR